MLTSHDLEQIKNLLNTEFIKFEEKLSQKFDSKLEHIKTYLTNKIDERADQIIEYINPSIENHEKRITRLENNSSYLIRDAKKE